MAPRPRLSPAAAAALRAPALRAPALALTGGAATRCRWHASAATPPAPAPTTPPQPALSEELPGIPKLRPARNLPSPKLEMTTLPNGLRVLSQELHGSMTSTIALFVDAGNMYEAPDEIGACHFLEAVAFKTTARRSSADIQTACGAHGITTSAVFNREVLMYKVDALRSSLRPALELLAEGVLAPAFTDTDLDEARSMIAFQREEAASQPSVLVSEQLYAAAYGGASPLGRPEKCPVERVGAVSGATLRGYAAKYFTARRMVLSGVGVEHAELAAAAAALFGGVPPEAHPAAAAHRPSSASAAAPRASAAAALGPYAGGDVRSSPDWAALPATVAAATAKTEFTHFMLAFPTVGWSHDDVVPICVVDTLLGGGSSFSAGGPGKGMYSRLYRQVLNAYSWVEAANAFSAQLYDAGLVGIYGACPPEHAGALVRVASTHLARLVDVPVTPAELARARNQLASSVLMNLETRGLLAEDIGRQVLSHGKRLDPGELVRRIQAVGPGDVQRVMAAALAHPPAFSAVGDTSTLPAYTAIAGFFDNARAGHVAAAGGARVTRMTGASATRSAAGAHVERLLQTAAAAAAGGGASSSSSSQQRGLHTRSSSSSGSGSCISSGGGGAAVAAAGGPASCSPALQAAQRWAAARAGGAAGSSSGCGAPPAAAAAAAGSELDARPR